MSECWDEGGLRAYIDRELPAEDLSRVAAHLGRCAECHARSNELAARAVRVSSMMAALIVAAPYLAAAPRPWWGRRWAQPVALAALAVAAAAALAFVLIPKRAAEARPVAAPRVERVHRPIQAEAPSLEPGSLTPAASGNVRRAKPPRRAGRVKTEDFLALDDDPIDVGIVMRVALDSAASVQADVIFDAQGRARAIRPVGQTSK